MTSPTNRAISTVLLDVDGTLVNSNDAHATWVAAFAEAGIAVPFADVRRLIGMGGDKLMPQVSNLTEDSPEGKMVAEACRQSPFGRVDGMTPISPAPSPFTTAPGTCWRSLISRR